MFFIDNNEKKPNYLHKIKHVMYSAGTSGNVLSVFNSKLYSNLLFLLAKNLFYM